jgi:hypothetical protein
MMSNVEKKARQLILASSLAEQFEGIANETAIVLHQALVLGGLHPSSQCFEDLARENQAMLSIASINSRVIRNIVQGGR